MPSTLCTKGKVEERLTAQENGRDRDEFGRRKNEGRSESERKRI